MASYTERDVDIVARTILGEAGNQSYTGKVAVASTIANRAYFTGKSPAKEALRPGAFSAWNSKNLEGNDLVNTTNGRNYEEARRIAEGVLSGVIPDPTNGSIDYFNPKDPLRKASPSTKTRIAEVNNSGDFIDIGDHRFSQNTRLALRGAAPPGTLAPGMAADSVDRYAERAELMRPRGFPTGKPGELGGPQLALLDAPASSRAVTIATQPPSQIAQIASWLSNIAERAGNEAPRPPADVPKMQDRIAPEQWGGPIYTSNDPPLSSGMRRTPTGSGTMAAPVSPVTRASLPSLSTAMRTNAQDAIDGARRPAPPRSSSASIDQAFNDVSATRSPSFFYSRENAPKSIDPFSWDIGPGNNWAAAAPRLSAGGFPPLSQPVAGNPRQMDNTAGRPGAPSGNTPVSWIPASITQAPIPSGDRTTVNNVSGSFSLPSMAPMLSASQSAAGMMGRGIVNGLTSMGQAADNAATSWKNVLNPAYTAAQKSLAAARAQQSSGTMGAIGDPRRQDMTAGAPGGTPQAVSDAIAKAMQTLASTPQTIRVPSLSAPQEVRTLPQLTPAINAPSGGGGNNSSNPFAAAGMQQIGTAPSGAALWSNGNGQVFSGNAPSNLFGGMGFGGGGGSFRGVNNY